MRRPVHPGAGVVVTVSLYRFASPAEAVDFFREMTRGDSGAEALDVGQEALGKSKEQPSARREAFPASVLLFRRGPVVALLVTGALDGNAAQGKELTREEIIDLQDLVEIARLQDRRLLRLVDASEP